MDFSVVAPKPTPKRPDKAAAPAPAAPDGDEYIPPPRNDTTPMIQPRHFYGDHRPCIGGPVMCYDDLVCMRRMKGVYGPNCHVAPYDHCEYYGGGAPRRYISPFVSPPPPPPPPPQPPHPQYWFMPPSPLPPPPRYGPLPPCYGPPPPPPMSNNPHGYGYDPYSVYYSDDDSYGCVVM